VVQGKDKIDREENRRDERGEKGVVLRLRRTL
jgi:hypothetical protein